MASDYGYTDVAGLEAFAGQDYSAINAKYVDGIIEAQISQAERIVNEYKRQSYSGTIPDDVKSATLMIARRFMKNILIEDGHFEDDQVVIEDYIGQITRKLLKDSSKKYDIKIITNVTDNFFLPENE